jgi:hypothetical protein
LQQDSGSLGKPASWFCRQTGGFVVSDHHSPKWFLQIKS